MINKELKVLNHRLKHEITLATQLVHNINRELKMLKLKEDIVVDRKVEARARLDDLIALRDKMEEV